MTILPYQQGDVVLWDGLSAYVVEARGDRIVVETQDGMLHITTQDRVRERQPRRPAA